MLKSQAFHRITGVKVGPSTMCKNTLNPGQPAFWYRDITLHNEAGEKFSIELFGDSAESIEIGGCLYKPLPE